MIFGGGGRHRGQAHHEPGVRRPLRFLIEEFQDHHTRISTYMHTLLAAAKHQQRARSASTDTRHTRARPNFTMQTDADSAQMDQLQLCGERKEGRRKLGAQETRKSSRSCTSTFRLYRPRQHTHFLASLTLCSDPETHRRTTLPSATPLPTLNQTMAATAAAAVLCFCAPKSCSFLFHLYPVRA